MNTIIDKLNLIEKLRRKLKPVPTLLANELKGTTGPKPKQMSMRLLLDEANYDSEMEADIIAACRQEAEAEWVCSLFEQARRQCQSKIVIDTTKPDRSGNYRGYMDFFEEIEDAFAKQLDGFVNPMLIISPTILTLFGESKHFVRHVDGRSGVPEINVQQGFSNRAGRVARFHGRYRRAPVIVDQYATGRECDLIVDQNWFSVISDSPVELSKIILDQHWMQPAATFTTDVEFNLDLSKVRAVEVQIAWMGFI